MLWSDLNGTKLLDREANQVTGVVAGKRVRYGPETTTVGEYRLARLDPLNVSRALGSQHRCSR